MRPFAILIILTLPLSCFGQFPFDNSKISKKTQKIVTAIEKVNVVMSSAVYYEGIRPRQYDHFTKLQKCATQNELIELTNHANGVVRCYAFWALSYDPSANLLPILVHHIPDTAAVDTQFGCIGGMSLVGDFLIDIVTPQHVDLRSKKLTPAEFEYLDSMLIYTPNSLYSKADAIARAKKSENFYQKVRDLVLKENNQPALVTLAKFKREQDIPIILENKKGKGHPNQVFYTFKAVSEFPNDAFLPMLRASLYEAMDVKGWSTEMRELYRAIASFKNDSALQLLKIPFTAVKNSDIRPYHINFIFEAVQEFYTPIYDELLWEMWENDKKINPQLFRQLYAKNPNKAFQLTQKTIEHAGDFYYLSTGDYNDADDEKPVDLIGIMLDTLAAHNRPYALELINNNIRKVNVHSFPTFADQAMKLKDASSVIALFDRLETEDNPYIYLKATEVLIAFKDEGINKRIIEVSKRNPNLKYDWGGEEFARLLKKNKINE